MRHSSPNADVGMTTLKGLGILFLSIALMGQATPSMADTSFGQSSNIFNIGAGARSMAMGGAFTGLADDAAAAYYNPAGLAYLDEHQLLAMHAPLFLDTNYSYLSSAHPFGDKWGSLAASLALISSDGFEIRDQFNNVTNDNGSLSNNAFVLSYAHKLPMNLSGGANIKFLQQKVEGFSGDDFGLDLAFMYKPTTLFQAGLMLANVNEPAITLDTEEDTFNPLTRFGIASEVFKDKLTITADVTKIRNQSSIFATGLEFTPTRLFQLRGGYNANRSYTFGVGINIKPVTIDYAFSDTDLGAFNKFSVTWAWHNIYRTDIEPPIKAGRAVYPLAGFVNNVAFHTRVPSHIVARWSLEITDKDGKKIRTIEGDLRPPKTIEWDAKNEMGEPVVHGIYNYVFHVKYKNGKDWKILGDVSLELPNYKVDEVIDMSLQLNGTQGDGEEEVRALEEIKKEEESGLIEKNETQNVELNATTVTPTQEQTEPAVEPTTEAAPVEETEQ